MKNLSEKIEEAIIREQIGSRGGGVEIDLGLLDDIWDGELMSAYQNYLGGGMLGSVQNDCTIDNWENICILGGYDLSKVAEELRKNMHQKTNSHDEWEGSSYEDNQERSGSAY
jgi:phage tail tube protein FII